jgi:lactate dehydrogenase-like 2-hydroxyacid dehydrogenase
MKVIAYSVKPFEKEFLAKANKKKHDITLISNPLSIETAIFARGKEAVIVFTNDDVSETVIRALAGFGVKYIATRSLTTHHIDKAAAARYGIAIANVPDYPAQAVAYAIASPIFFCDDDLELIASRTINNIDLWQNGKPTGKARNFAAQPTL